MRATSLYVGKNIYDCNKNERTTTQAIKINLQLNKQIKYFGKRQYIAY